MIKYIGSKRRLVPTLTELYARSGAGTALDLFTGTTRVAQAFKAAGADVTAVDTARYSEIFARTWIETDAATVETRELDAAIGHLNALPGRPGYVTETFCERSRFFQPHNGERIDAPVEKGFAAIEREWRAGDRVVLNLPMSVRVTECHPAVKANTNRVAFTRGPFVLCAEGVDNGGATQRFYFDQLPDTSKSNVTTMTIAAITCTTATWAAITMPRMIRTSRPRKYETMMNFPWPGPNAWMTP